MDSSSQKCPICYETIQNKNFIVTKCNHTFCSNCILRLNRSSNSCPLCRADLTNIPIAENLNNPEENILYTNQFYRRILEESENSINSLEMSLESYRYIIQNLNLFQDIFFCMVTFCLRVATSLISSVMLRISLLLNFYST